MTGGTAICGLHLVRCEVCGRHISHYCVLCLGTPDAGLSIEQLARGVTQVDRATRGTA
jgi:hypothetical protein